VVAFTNAEEARFDATPGLAAPAPGDRSDLRVLDLAGREDRSGLRTRPAPKGGAVLVHRFAYKTWVDPDLPDDVCVLHTCDNPPCFNPAHLFSGTKQDNARDMADKGRNRTFGSGADHWMRRRPDLIPRGDRHHNAKVTEEQVRAIRADPRSAIDVAADYGLSKVSIFDIRARRSWKHVD
jgi:hypothetical protein